jgi:hypothetical protein
MRVRTVAVNIEMMLPPVSVTAKPLMGPVPNWKSRADAMSSVRFESMMASEVP